jgi:7,8-dihydropterin-6-yl-methyl-4-(beta-D-ribofuranosyl)aminobenzene 5'-phosphate synthase
MKFTILCEDQGKNSTYLLGESSLSVLIEDGDNRILFDTGGHTLEHNARLMGVDLSTIDLTVLSHSHWDHSNGLLELSKYVRNIPLFLHPDCFRNTYVLYRDYPQHIAFQPDRLHKISVGGKEHKAKYIGLPLSLPELQAVYDVRPYERPVEVAPGILFLGGVPRRNDFEAQKTFTHEIEGGDWKESYILDDSGLVIKTNKGLIVVSGCGHAGICNTVEYAKEVCSTEEVFAVFGGFHLLRAEKGILDKTLEYLKAQNLQHLYPCHCVDAHAMSRFIEEFNCEKVCAGDVIDWSVYGIQIAP